MLLECFWIAFGLLLDCFWIAFGLLLDCFWIAFGLLLVNKTGTHSKQKRGRTRGNHYCLSFKQNRQIRLGFLFIYLSSQKRFSFLKVIILEKTMFSGQIRSTLGI